MTPKTKKAKKVKAWAQYLPDQDRLSIVAPNQNCLAYPIFTSETGAKNVPANTDFVIVPVEITYQLPTKSKK